MWHAAECCTKEHVPVIKVLLAEKVDLETHNEYKQTPLYFAAGRDVHVSKALVDAGADIKCSDKHGVTPVDRAFRLLQTEGIRDTYDFFVLLGAPRGVAIPHQGDMGKLINRKGKPRNWQ